MEKYWHLIEKYNQAQSEDEKFAPGEDGTFLMCYSDWRDIYNNLFISVDFPDDWSGIRF